MRQGDTNAEQVFEGIRAAFLIGLKETGADRKKREDAQELIEEFREKGGRVLDLNKCKYSNS
jgi:hypothetical protein